MRKVAVVFSLCFLFLNAGYSQLKPIQPKVPTTVPPFVTDYQSVEGDPTGARIYTLSNGLKVYLSVNKNSPRVQTYIAVGAGSKNDPRDATGLAHYLEHMLFKGTDKFGTLDYSKEEPLLKKIEDLYEKYRQTKDSKKRKVLYRQIDSLSGVAAKYAIANEYDKLMSSIGAKGTNAYTWVEQTVYVNDIPSNQIGTWLEIEAERFRKPVMRIFHTELEAVYEEKNISMDSDQDKLWEATFENLFKKHTYGTQTTIGTIEHLKNPSLKKIKEYYNKYYVPNNMAICMSGDFNPDSVIAQIQKTFGGFERKPLNPFVAPSESPIKSPRIVNVVGPNPETVLLAYRFSGAGTRDADLLELTGKILFNGTAGLIDLNLNQKQKVLAANAFPIIMKDYSAFILNGDPKDGQNLEEVKNLLLAEIEKLKSGNFPEWILPAVIENIRLDDIRRFENNAGRADAFVNAFILGQNWQDVVRRADRLAKYTKADILDFVKKNFTNNYVAVFKEIGVDLNVKKVEKPEITPVSVNRDNQSPFVKAILAKEKKDIEPVFVDFSKDIKVQNLNKEVDFWYTQNTQNNLFNLTFVIKMGERNDPWVPIAYSYLKYLGAGDKTSEELKQEFFKIACDYSIDTDNEEIYISVSGLDNNMEKALILLKQLIQNPSEDPEILKNLTSDIIKKRADAKLDQSNILWGGLYNLGVYGEENPFNTIIPTEDLKKADSKSLIEKIKNTFSFSHHVLYYGPSSFENSLSVIKSQHTLADKYLPIPQPRKFTPVDQKDTRVYLVDFDMKQAEILMVSKGPGYNKDLMPKIRLFNEYFGGGMSSIVFQDLRESKALAYSVFSNFSIPETKEKPFIVHAYIGTQADKLNEALAGMMNLLSDLPTSPVMFEGAKESLLQNLRTQRYTGNQILIQYLRARKLGLTEDIRKKIFDEGSNLSLQDIKSFHEGNYKNRKYNILIVGKVENIDKKILLKYGPVKVLTLEEVFGY
jgi:predicted Zn-dependent peptidase